jgi:hypothetical protein
MTMFYTKEEIARQAPTVMAAGPDEFRSDRYVFVSSEKIIDSMEDNGWGVANVRTPKVRVASPQHCRHELVFRSRDEDLKFEDPRAAGISTYGNFKAVVHPELRVTNSSDGSTRVEIAAGILATICSNGLTITLSDFGSFSTKHLGFDSESAYEVTSDFAGRIPGIVERIDEFTGVHLNSREALKFAADARDLRWKGDRSSLIDPKDLLNARRPQDDGDDLWRIYNRVQENIMRGGFSSANTKRRVRPISNIKLDNDINKGLWDLAETYCLN